MLKDNKGNIFNGVTGNLSLDKKYTIVDYYIIEYRACQNCGRIIKNIFVINDGEKNYEVGSECVKRFTDLIPSYELEWKRKMNRLLNFIKFVKTKTKTIIIDEFQDSTSVMFYKCLVDDWSPYYVYRCDIDYYKKQIEPFVRKDTRIIKIVNYSDNKEVRIIQETSEEELKQHEALKAKRTSWVKIFEEV